MKALRFATLTTLVVGASLGLAGPANAELQDGSYTATITESNKFQVGQTQTWNVGSCGPDCRHVELVGGDTPYDFHRDGSTWTASQPSGAAHGFTTTIENDSLAGTFTFDDGAFYKYQLKKN
ncbi:hypothetical protein AWC16_14875 [Mycolicibacter longobardus]|uniref:Uncharacterized protein n=2 Tax=Mycolicibacter longobardus TaxID=1108812 RepID=A0A1X1YFD6_9MYCO|nr:hypothetical protein AWC16_14875 [Mycolicibacter longobardus]